jgi:hypothetical protein
MNDTAEIKELGKGKIRSLKEGRDQNLERENKRDLQKYENERGGYERFQKGRV